MKYFCLAEKDQELSIFLFPKELDDEGIKNDITRGLRNQTHGRDWRRFQFELKAKGNISFADSPFSLNKIVSSFNTTDLMLYEMTESVFYHLIATQLSCNMKYICISGKNGSEYIYLFPKFVHHDAMEEVISHMSYAMESCHYEKLISAGFVNSNLECFGESETLGIPSRKDKDTNLLRQQLKGD